MINFLISCLLYGIFIAVVIACVISFIPIGIYLTNNLGGFGAFLWFIVVVIKAAFCRFLLVIIMDWHLDNGLF